MSNENNTPSSKMGWPEEPTDDMLRALFTLNSATARTTDEVRQVYQHLRNLAALSAIPEAE